MDATSELTLGAGAAPAAASPTAGRRPAVSVVFPCLNEQDAIGACVTRAREAMTAAGLDGEVVVVDNGSTDGSAAIAAAHGARVVHEPSRGYGNACRRGLLEATGDSIVLLDSDGTYPVELVGEFVRRIEQDGADLVIGNRFAGRLEHGAMPFLNRYVGNPVLSWLTRLLFRANVADIHCGMRAVRRDRVAALDLRTPGMEFATEMVVKAVDQDLTIAEVPLPYRQRIGRSKLSPWRDAWRHVEYMLALSPMVLFVWPGITLYLGGLAVQLVLLSGPRPLLFRAWDVHTNLAGLAASLCGATLIALGLVAIAYAWTAGLRFRHSPAARAIARLRDAPVRIAGVVVAATGAAMWILLVLRWALSGFGSLAAVPFLSLATSLLASGLELLGAAFLIHMIHLRPVPSVPPHPRGQESPLAPTVGDTR
ncbi:MAG TPA: glycosyltransferase family 2 protein [Gemmatimonadales bacterium]|nr:glycosyltransferase family 2 protein [Gemmatimonadales bacterium]